MSNHVTDPALDQSKQHHHEHLHHSDRVDHSGHDDPAYSQGASPYSPAIIPAQDPSHGHGTKASGEMDDKEKVGGIESPSSRSLDDEERGGAGSASRRTQFKILYKRHKWAIHLFIFLLFTGWWIASLVLHRNDKNWIVPFLVWLCISLRMFFFHVPISIVTRPMHFVWNHTGVVVYDTIPSKLRVPAGAALTVSVILIGTFVSEESADNTRKNRAVSLFGLIVLLFGLWLTSHNRKAINWRPVIMGMLTQYIIALFVLRTSVGYDIFKFIADRAANLLEYAGDGTAFLTAASVLDLHWFITGVIPPIIFFVSLVQVLYFIGFLQWFIVKFATFVFWAMRVSGAEAVVAAATPFIGQGESAMLVRPFVPHMTRAEIHQIMACGFATISGSVLVAYISLGLNAQAMVSSCIMSIPASLAISKLRYPETEDTLTAGKVVVPDDDEHKASNALHAFANGAWLGIKIAGMIVATLLCILAAIGLVNGLLTWWGGYININSPPLTIQLIVGYICYPIAWLLGVPAGDDLLKVGQLIGIKIIANEYVAFSTLSTDPSYQNLTARSRLIATYALCGFGNVGSLGIQIGILSQLAPGRSGDVSRLAVSALISGVLATLTSAAVAGLVVTDQKTALGL